MRVVGVPCGSSAIGRFCWKHAAKAERSTSDRCMERAPRDAPAASRVSRIASRYSVPHACIMLDKRSFRALAPSQTSDHAGPRV